MQIRKIMEKRILRVGAVMLAGAITIGAGYVLYRDGSETIRDITYVTINRLKRSEQD